MFIPKSIYVVTVDFEVVFVIEVVAELLLAHGIGAGSVGQSPSPLPFKVMLFLLHVEEQGVEI